MTLLEPRSIRKQKKQRSTPGSDAKGLILKEIDPLTINQEKAIDAFISGKHLLLHGFAGTGKTFLSLYLALDEILNGDGTYKQLVIMRSTVPSRDMGYLPGSAKEKAKVYEAPYHAVCAELFGRGDAYDILKVKGIIDFQTTSFIRGITLDDCILVVDEIQNFSKQEWYSVLTRVGKNARIMICGDTKQDDLTSERYKEESGIRDLLLTFNEMKCTEIIQFEIRDVLRSGFVKEMLIAMYNLNI